MEPFSSVSMSYADSSGEWCKAAGITDWLLVHSIVE